MKSYLLLRKRVLGRQLLELGWWRMLLLGSFGIVALGEALFTLATHHTAQWLLPLLALLLLLSYHRRRADLAFLHLTAPDFRPWLAVEYALWSLPALLVLVGFGRLGAALLTVALASLVAWVPAATPRPAGQRRASMFRGEAFEWVSGTRQTGAVWVWLALLAAAAWWRQYAMAPAAALGGWVLVVTAFYGTPEPWSMLLPALRRPEPWLRRRVGLALLCFLLTAAPFAWLMGTGPAGWGGAGAALVWGTVVLTMVVLTRYAFYPNALLVRLTQGGVVAVACLLFGHPIYPVILLVAFFGLIWKSRRTLSFFRHD